jgi:hypothetical protein
VDRGPLVQSPAPAGVTEQEKTMHARTRRTRNSRVRPHVQRRNGIIDAPSEQSKYDERPYVALAYGWRAFG